MTWGSVEWEASEGPYVDTVDMVDVEVMEESQVSVFGQHEE